MSTFVYQIECQQEEDGRWSASVPELPGCATWGYTREEALDSLKEAVVAYLTTLAEDGKLPQQAQGVRCFDKAPVLAVAIKLSA